jgi:ribosomal protein S11
MVNSVLYKDLPIVHIKSTKNNTIFSLTDARGKVLYSTSAVRKFLNKFQSYFQS